MFECKICKKNFSNKGGLSAHEPTCEKVFSVKDEIIKLYVDELWSIKEIAKKFNLGNGTVYKLVGENIRSKSQGNVIAHKKYPESYLHKKETKEKMSKKRLEFMKNNPEKTSWRQKNISYPEKLFLDRIIELSWDKKYSIVRELSFFPFFIDFAFVNENVAIEIDGSQHLLQERKERDEKKDRLLIENGWTVIRISEKEVKNNLTEITQKIEEVLLSLSKEKKYEFGVLVAPKKYEKKQRLDNGLTEEQYNSHIKQRKKQRPNYEELKRMVELEGYVSVGKKYGVSDNCIKNWILFYDKYENK
jgi:very-short-patch-repair endonuclease